MSAISVSDVSMMFKTRRGQMQALDRVSLEIPDAHFACIVGASGCGKSTLLNIMGGLVRPTSGTVQVDGRQIHGPGTDRGMVFQSYTLFPWLRVRENVEFGPRLKSMAKEERRRIFEDKSQHIAASMKYLPAIARQLYHCRDLGEPFDFLTWFEYAPEHADMFEELVAMLRATEEWTYVAREVDVRVVLEV